MDEATHETKTLVNFSMKTLECNIPKYLTIFVRNVSSDFPYKNTLKPIRHFNLGLKNKKVYVTAQITNC